MTTRDEAIVQLTAAGSPFELEVVPVHGYPVRTYKNAHRNLREIWNRAAQRGDAPYFIYDDVVTTYGQADQEITSLAAWLFENGIRKGDRVAVGMRNYPEFAIAFWAIQSIGAVMVSLNAWWIGEELKYALKDSGAIAAILDGERQDRLTSDMMQELGVRLVVVTRGEARSDTTEWAEAVGNTAAVLPQVDIAPDDDATILYTSGTTGFPKGAAGSHRNYVTNVWNAIFSIGVASVMAGGPIPDPFADRPHVTALSTFPFFHIAGLCGMISSTNNGTTIVSQFKWDATDALRLVEKYKVNQIGGVPTVVRSFLEHPDRDKYDLSSLANIAQGGAPVAPDTIARIESDFAGKVSPGNGYGLTETTAGCIANGGAAYFAKKDSVGLPAVGTDVRILDEDGNEVPQGSIGEVCIYGPQNVRGYWNKPAETAKAFVDGWFHSGDAGYIDEDGFIYVVDRIKDMVLRGGENVYCVEVETALFEIDAVLDCAVIGLPHAKLGEEVAAVLVAAEGFDESATSSVLEYLSGRLAAFKVPSKVFWHHEDLPRNATGKVLKKDLRDYYANR